MIEVLLILASLSIILITLAAGIIAILEARKADKDYKQYIEKRNSYFKDFGTEGKNDE